MHNPLQTMLFLGDKYFIDKSDHVTIFTKCQLHPPPIINDMSSIHISQQHESNIIVYKNQPKIHVATVPWGDLCPFHINEIFCKNYVV